MMEGIQRSIERVIDHSLQLNEAAQLIASLNDSLDGLSQQTELLALNSLFESAANGEQGRELNQVSEEVRALAAQCAEVQTEVGRIVAIVADNVANSLQRLEKLLEKKCPGTTRPGALSGLTASEQSGSEASQGIHRHMARLTLCLDCILQYARQLKSDVSDPLVPDDDVNELASNLSQSSAALNQLINRLNTQ